MIAQNPYDLIRAECQTALAAALAKSMPDIKQPPIILKKTPNIDYGQLATSLCFELAKQLKQKPIDLAKQLSDAVDKSSFNLIEKVEPAGAGYINFYVNFPKFCALIFASIKELDESYGFVKIDQPQKIIVEHTSVNPLHPIHIGQARNPTIGDTLARILQLRGHNVSRHSYIDDVGRQSSVVAYGYAKLGKPKPTEKADHFVGKITRLHVALWKLTALRSSKSNLLITLKSWLKLTRNLTSGYRSPLNYAGNTLISSMPCLSKSA
jgi:arginyl-tRNA synthetase